jgi:thymidylate synthase (FAD)
MQISKIEVELQDHMGSDRSIAESAWTSSLVKSSKSKKPDEDVSKVIKYLAEHKHSTPFESVVFRFWIRMPIYIDRQHMTHRIASHNGLSGRYRTLPSDFMSIPQDVMDIVSKVDPAKSLMWKAQYDKLCKDSHDFYLSALNDLKTAQTSGIIDNREYKRAREIIRGPTPIATMTERITTMNLRSFANYQKLRNSEHAQVEIVDVAQQMLEQVKLKNICPISVSCLESTGWNI